MWRPPFANSGCCWPETRRILLTGFINPELFASGPDDALLSACLLKPVRPTELAKAIEEGGTVEVPLAGPTVTLPLPEDFRCEAEVEIHGEEVELEIELKWSPGTT